MHYRQIQVADQATADDLKAQIDGGADFAALAAANSTDTATKDSGRRRGLGAAWLPQLKHWRTCSLAWTSEQS